MDYDLVAVATSEDWRAFHDIRRRELFEAKGRFGVYDDTHPDDLAPGNHPYLLKGDGRPLGVTRLDLWPEGMGIFRLVAITASEQNRGFGRILERLVVERAVAFGARTLCLNAIDTAVGFYRATGWMEYLWDDAEQARAGANCAQMRKLV